MTVPAPVLKLCRRCQDAVETCACAFPPPPSAPQISYYSSYANRGYLSPELQLAELRARLNAGLAPEAAASLLPVFVGGPVDKAIAMGLAPAAAAGGEAAHSGAVPVAPPSRV